MSEQIWTKEQMDKMVENFYRKMRNDCPICDFPVEVADTGGAMQRKTRDYMLVCRKCHQHELHEF